MDILPSNISEIVEKQNKTPLADFDGFSPVEMGYILYDPFSENGPIKIKRNLENNVLKQSPIFNIVIDLLTLINETGGIKLTPKGNIQRKVIHELYAKKYLLDKFVESGTIKLRVEEDWGVLHVTKIVLKLAGILRHYKGKLVLTNRWKKALEAQAYSDIFMAFLTKYATEYSWAYTDGYENRQTGQVGFLFLLHLVNKYGKDFRDLHFYSKKYFRAFPMLAVEGGPYYEKPRYNEGENILYIRFFKRFAHRFGLVEIKTDGNLLIFGKKAEIKKTRFLSSLLDK
jgi:hypothetical protein